jgi:hypothetical protein
MPYLKSLLLGVAMLISWPSHAFKLSPEGTFIERRLAAKSQNTYQQIVARFALAGITKIGEPVHEEITNRMLGCEGDADICGSPDYDPKNAYFIAGVRWNDDPPFRFESGHGSFFGCEPGTTIRLNTVPTCWANVFRYGKKLAAERRNIGDSFPILLRSHFGDLQFLHAMASEQDEAPTTTRTKILVWAEFAWRVALNEFDLSSRVRDTGVEGIAEIFSTKGWSILDLFSLGNPHIRRPEYLSEVALGSLLHLVQDSFAAGHVERAIAKEGEQCPSGEAAPGPIVEFHAYGLQDSALHAAADSRVAFSAHWSSDRPNVVDVGRTIVDGFRRKQNWASMKPYLECIFRLHRDAHPASSGNAFQQR